MRLSGDPRTLPCAEHKCNSFERSAMYGAGGIRHRAQSHPCACLDRSLSRGRWRPPPAVSDSPLRYGSRARAKRTLSPGVHHSHALHMLHQASAVYLS